MKKEDFFEVLGELDGDFVTEAKEKKDRNRAWVQWAAVAACLALIAAAAFFFKSEKSPVEVSFINGADTVNYVEYEWAVVTEDMAYTENTVILTGAAANVRQATVRYRYMDADAADSITIFDVVVSDVLACRSGSFQAGDVITVGVGYNTEKYGEGLPMVKEGTSYLMFCTVAADQQEDALALAEYVDCWIGAPKDLFLEKAGNSYLSIGSFFSDLPDARNLADSLDLTEKQAASLSAAAVDDAEAAKAFIEETIVSDSGRPDLTEFADALALLRTRIGKNSSALWSLARRAYLIDCGKLEGHIRRTALTYGG